MRGKRTIITLPDEDKIWLENYSKAYHISLAEAVRQGIKRLREAEAKNTYNILVKNTRGVWTKGDALSYQKNIRSEWDLK